MYTKLDSFAQILLMRRYIINLCTQALFVEIYSENEHRKHWFTAGSVPPNSIR